MTARFVQRLVARGAGIDPAPALPPVPTVAGGEAGSSWSGEVTSSEVAAPHRVEPAAEAVGPALAEELRPPLEERRGRREVADAPTASEVRLSAPDLPPRLDGREPSPPEPRFPVPLPEPHRNAPDREALAVPEPARVASARMEEPASTPTRATTKVTTPAGRQATSDASGEARDMPRDSGEPPRASMPSSVLGTTPEVAAPVAVTALRAGDVEAARPVPVASFAPGEQGAQRSPRASASEAEGRAAADLPRPPAERDRPSVAERTPAAAERPAVHIGQIEVRVDAPAPPSATSVPPVSPAGFDDYVDLRSFG